MTNNKIETLQSRKYKSGFVPPEEQIMFTINNKTIGCLSSFVTFQGMPKNGKSLFITSAIASAYCHHDIFGMKLNFPNDRKRLCFVDTESSDFDFYKTLERIRKQMYSDFIPHNLDAYCFREDAPKDILEMIEIYLEEHSDCSVLVIDGILDLISDFNNIEMSFNLIQWLKRITKKYQLLILCVLHLGKSTAKNSVGHIGSYLDRKSQSVLTIEKNKERNTIELSPAFLRSTDDFDTISIQYSGNQWIQIQSESENTNTNIHGIDKAHLLFKILLEPKTYNNLLNDLCEAIGKGQTTGKKIIKQWIADGTIYKVDDKYKKRG